MRKLIFAAFLMAGMAGIGYAQELPKEVKMLLDNYVKDSTALLGPLTYKRWGHIPDNVQLKDLKFKVLEAYTHRDVPLDEYPDTVAFSEIITPRNMWYILVMAHNKPLYELRIRNSIRDELYGLDAKLRIEGGAMPSVPGSDFDAGPIWESLSKTYNESITETRPVLVASFYGHTYPEGPLFLYFKHKGPRSVYYIPSRWQSNPINSFFADSTGTLEDSKKIVRYWKERGTNGSFKRMLLERPGTAGRNRSIEPTQGSNPAFERGKLREINHKDIFPAGGSQ
jgi:hypothetical protein